MKALLVFIAISLFICQKANSASFFWNVGKTGSRLKINNTLTTASTFNLNFKLHLMYIGYDPAPYTSTKGYSTFLKVATGIHDDTVSGLIQGTVEIVGGTELTDRQYIPALYEKATEKYYFISETSGGSGIAPYTLAEVTGDPLFDIYFASYYPTSSTGNFYKGAEIPPFCGWLATNNLVQANLVGLNTNQVNLAFAVNANPTNFNNVAVSITNFVIGASSMNGKFSAVSYDAQNIPSSVMKLNGTATLSLVTAPTLSGITNAISDASVNLSNKTFQVTRGATNTTEFFHLKLNVPNVW